MPLHRVAVVQAGSSLFNTPRTLERMRAHCEAAKREAAELVVFPEAYVGGYPKGLDFGARVGSRTAAGREDFRRYAGAAIVVPGTETAALGEFAQSLGAWLVTGAIEREGGTLYCAVLTFAPGGALVARRRKLMPTASERLVWGQGDGSTLPVVQTGFGGLSAAICWENYMPALRQALHARGATLWAAPTVDDREIWGVSMRHIAYEGRMFVLSACQWMTRADAPADYACVQGDDPATVLIGGGSVIVSPMGQVLAGPLPGGEGVLCADIDPDDVTRARYDLDISGHYARPDVFELRVDERAKAAVAFDSDVPR